MIKEFGEDISRHIGSRNQSSGKRTVLYESPNEVVSNIDVFGMSQDSRRIKK
jgi:hypothetical protein